MVRRNIVLWCAAIAVAVVSVANASTAAADTPPAAAAPGLLANVVAPASYPAYGTLLVPGCAWATWLTNCGNLGVYSNGGNFGTEGCGPPNGCTYGPEFQCTELAQRYAAYAWREPDNWYGIGGDGSAASMWTAGPSLPVPLAQYPNGGDSVPEPGDLLVFGPGWIGSYWDPAGHVAVITAVGPGYVDIVQENGTASGRDSFALNGSTISQPNGYTPLIGWMRPHAWTGPIDLSAQWAGARPSGSPVSEIDGASRLVFWRGTENHLWEAWSTPGVGWQGPVDISAELGGPVGALLGSQPSLLQAPGGQQLVFWEGNNNHLWEAWYTPGSGWYGPVDWTAQLGGTGLLASAPTVVMAPGNQQLAFWHGSNGHLWEAWFTPGVGWNGPLDYTPQLTGTALLASAPTVVLTPGGQQLVFWRNGSNHLAQSWFTPNVGWLGPVDWSAQLGMSGPLESTPSVGLTSSGQTLVFWQGTDNHLWEAWFTPGTGWLGPADWTAGLGGSGSLASAPDLEVTSGGEQRVVWQGVNHDLWEAWFIPGTGWNSPQDQLAVRRSKAAGTVADAPSLVSDGTTDFILWQAPSNHLFEVLDS